jgi:hypothetical protein
MHSLMLCAVRHKAAAQQSARCTSLRAASQVLSPRCPCSPQPSQRNALMWCLRKIGVALQRPIEREVAAHPLKHQSATAL